jgi:two-component system, NarL family, response regulator NreC
VKKLSVLLADDHPALREGVVALINRQPDMRVVGEAGTGREALRKACQLAPDVLVMDLSMPEMNGLQAALALRAECPQVKVLVFTMHEDESYLRQLCKAKVLGYTLKRSPGDELVKAIRKVAAGEICFDAALAGKALAGQARASSSRLESPDGDLSEREQEVLRAVAWGYSNKEVAAQLGLSVKTVETYKVRVAVKLGLRSRTEMVRYALRQGWLSDAPALLQRAR